jgi:hypothetical protein
LLCLQAAVKKVKQAEDAQSLKDQAEMEEARDSQSNGESQEQEEKSASATDAAGAIGGAGGDEFVSDTAMADDEAAFAMAEAASMADEAEDEAGGEAGGADDAPPTADSLHNLPAPAPASSTTGLVSEGGVSEGGVSEGERGVSGQGVGDEGWDCEKCCTPNAASDERCEVCDYAPPARTHVVGISGGGGADDYEEVSHAYNPALSMSTNATITNSANATNGYFDAQAPLPTIPEKQKTKEQKKKEKKEKRKKEKKRDKKAKREHSGGAGSDGDDFV